MKFPEKKHIARFGHELLRRLPSKLAHRLGTLSLERRLLRPLITPTLPDSVGNMGVRVPGIGILRHPIGLAPGLNVNGNATLGFSKLGFSFIEIGSVTPRPAPGQHQPQIRQLKEQHGILKLRGFPSEGVVQVSRRLRKLRWDHEATPLGINLTKDSTTRNSGALDDFLQSLEHIKDVSKYVVINLPAPKIPGSFELSSVDFIQRLALHAQSFLPKIWLKLDPDMEKKQFQTLVDAIAAAGFQGLVLTNSRALSHPVNGAMSGAPISVMANARLEWAWQVHRGYLPMIASGGILSGSDIIERIIRGASAVQIYTACIQRGPWVVADMLMELAAEMDWREIANLEDVRGSYYE